MKIGIDFYDTITRDVAHFRTFTRALGPDVEVYIVNAIAEKNLPQLEKDIRKANIVYKELCPVFFEADHYFKVPALKYLLCEAKGIEAFIDDRIDVIQYLSVRGILTFHFMSLA